MSLEITVPDMNALQLGNIPSRITVTSEARLPGIEVFAPSTRCQFTADSAQRSKNPEEPIALWPYRIYPVTSCDFSVFLPRIYL